MELSFNILVLSFFIAELPSVTFGLALILMITRDVPDTEFRMYSNFEDTLSHACSVPYVVTSRLA